MMTPDNINNIGNHLITLDGLDHTQWHLITDDDTWSNMITLDQIWWHLNTLDDSSLHMMTVYLI